MKFHAASRATAFGSLFMREDRGVAAVEFALILPLLLVVYFGVTEVSRLARASQKVDQIARTLADLTSRKLDGGDAPGKAMIRRQDVTDLLIAARILLYPLPQEYFRFEVDELEAEDPNIPRSRPRVRWIIYRQINNLPAAGTRRVCDFVNRNPINEFTYIPPSLASGQSSRFIISARAQFDYGDAFLPKMFGRAFKLVSWSYAVPRALPAVSNDNPLPLWDSQQYTVPEWDNTTLKTEVCNWN